MALITAPELVTSSRPMAGSISPSATAASGAWWHRVQAALLVAGILLEGTLIVRPEIGLNLLWNVLIPLAPTLIVVAPGVWRNVCPMATLSLLPRYLCVSHGLVPSRRTTDVLGLLGVCALFLIVPLRHLSLDLSGPMTALMLLVAASFAFALGIAFEWRSGWCTSLCPIHPVEKLYGFAPLITVGNARCQSCRKCTIPCPDSTQSMTPLVTGPSPLAKGLGHLLVGGFVGFIWGWFRLPDYPGPVGGNEILAAYLWPFGGAAASLSAYAILRQLRCFGRGREVLPRIFATAAVSTYYWYRLPALGGFGPQPGTGMLYDLTSVLPAWAPQVSHLLTTAFFVWFLLMRSHPKASWMIRPAVQR